MVSLSGHADAIDSGKAVLEFIGFHRCRQEPRLDAGEVRLLLLDDAQVVLNASTIPVAPAHDRWLPMADAVPIPAGARSLRIILAAINRGADAVADCWFDGLSLTLLSAEPVTVTGTVTDDGIPFNAPLGYEWTQLLGPARAFIGHGDTLSASILPTAPGTYQFELSANDTRAIGRDTMELSITGTQANRAPVVSAGPDQSMSLAGPDLLLPGEVNDDGNPAGGTLSVSWTQLDGPADAVISRPHEEQVVFSPRMSGDYLLRLSAHDGELAAFDDVTVHVMCTEPRPLYDIMLVLDRSADVTQELFPIVKSSAAGFVDATDSLVDRMGVVAFDSASAVVQSLTAQKALVKSAVNLLSRTANSANLAGALSLAGQHFQTVGRPEARRVAVVVTGTPVLSSAAIASADTLEAAGVRVIVIGLRGDNPPDISLITSRLADALPSAGIAAGVDATFDSIPGMLCLGAPGEVVVSAGPDRQGISEGVLRRIGRIGRVCPGSGILHEDRHVDRRVRSGAGAVSGPGLGEHRSDLPRDRSLRVETAG